MPKKQYLKGSELEFIRQSCLSQTDEEIAKHLDRDIRTVKSARKKLGINKTAAGQVKNIANNDKAIVGQYLTEDQRKEFFKTQLVNSLYYKNLKEQFTKDEVNFYLEEWAALSVQFDDIANTEKRQIDELIKAEIMGNRILRNIKIAEDEINNLIKEVELFRKAKDVATDEDAQERDNQLMMMIQRIHGQSQAISNDYQRNVDLRSRLLNELNARRRDRIDQIKRGGTTFLGLIEAMRDKKVREIQGRHMELVRLAKEKKKADWSKPVTFPDGSKDCILMDENSILPTKNNIGEIVELQCKTVLKYKDLATKNILVIDDDQRRKQFFGEVFKNNNIVYASTVAKAIKVIHELDYDLICLDYDLGLEEKGIDFAYYILNKRICKDTEILIHSMNKEGAGKMHILLNTERKTEIYPFEDIIKEYRNA